MRLLFVYFLTLSGFAQTYTVATIAGGAPRAAPQANGSIGYPQGVAVDGSGNVYFFSLNCLFKLDRNGVVTRIAGNYSAGYSGDGGSATLAQLDPPPGVNSDIGLAVDAAGNVYIPDAAAGRVRKVSASGVIATVAGNGTLQTTNTGEGGPAVNAYLGGPNHVTFDSAGNLYIAEGVGRVHKVSADGTLTTVAGGGFNSAQPGDGGAAVGAYLNSAAGIAFDAAGNLYIAEVGANRIRKVSTAGIITTIAGTGTAGDTGDGGPAAAAQLNAPTDLAFDASGNLLIGEPQSYRIRKISTAGIISTGAGNGGWGYAGDGGPALAATIAPRGLAVDGAGNIYFADGGANRIRKIGTTGVVTTLAGDGTLEFSGDGGQAINAGLSMPGAMATDQAGNLYIADIGNNRVRKVAPDGTISTVAGNGSPGYAGDGGAAVNAEVMPTAGLAMDAGGYLYIEEAGRVRKVTPAGIITTISGTASYGPVSPPGNTVFNSGNRLAVDAQGSIYFVPAGIQKIAPDGSIAQLTNTRPPSGMAVDPSGTLYFSDSQNSDLFTMTAAGAVFLSITEGTGCAPLRSLGFSPNGLAFDKAGNLYLADRGYSSIRRISPSGGIDTIAGNLTYGYSGDGGPALAAQFATPTSIAVDNSGNIYVADAINNVVRVLKPAAPAPVTVTSVTSAASNLTGAIAAGEIAVVYGSGMGPNPMMVCSYGPSGLTDSTLNDTQVLFNGVAAKVLYTSAGQVAAVAPANLTGATAQVSVSYLGRSSSALSVPVASAAPALFAADGSGKGQAAAVNQDGSINNALAPAVPGEFVSLYATGVPSGQSVTVSIGGQSVAAQFAGQAPGYLSGLVQINAQIPAGLRANSATPVSIQVGTVASQGGVTLAVAGN